MTDKDILVLERRRFCRPPNSLTQRQPSYIVALRLACDSKHEGRYLTGKRLIRPKWSSTLLAQPRQGGFRIVLASARLWKRRHSMARQGQLPSTGRRIEAPLADKTKVAWNASSTSCALKRADR